MSTVKRRPAMRTRPYNASLRREQAGKSRERIVEAAERRFLRDGYRATTIAAIADDAGVSVDTIYKGFGGKPGLIRGIQARALRGGGAVPAKQRSEELHASEPDARKIVKGWAAFVTEIAPRSAPILLLVRDAASTYPELRALLEELDADRLRRMSDNARGLYAAGHLREGITIGHAARILWTYSSAELYELLVVRGGMKLRTYRGFVADAMIAALL
ncbi:MAG: TetR/AcrR family transcriptional regulator [Candidatus Dormibacteria bacterium]